MGFNLPSLVQIKGGKQLRIDVNTLLTSYDAYKVLTSISKGEGLGEYTADELLKVLKAQLDEIVGEGSELSLPALAEAIETLQKKAIKDIVRVQAKYAGNAVVLPEDFAALVPVADTAQPYPVYYLNNTPVLDANGQQLTLNLATQAFSGIPSVVDSSGKDPEHLVYVPVTGDFNFKFFPVGSFTFAELPANALLDNQELQSVAYAQAIDKIVTDLAQDQELIDSIKALVGETTVQDQITAITNALALRVKALEEDNTKVLKESIVTTIRKAEDAEDTKVTSEKAVAAAIERSIANVSESLENKAQENADRITAVEAIVLPVVDTIAITEETAKTEFSLSKTPNSHLVEMYINHFVYHEGEDFTVDRENKKIVWIATEAVGGFDINPELTDKVRIQYHSGEFITAGNSHVTLYGTAIPASGTYKAGDRILHTSPVTGGNSGWVCVEGGTPGTWLPYGVVDFDNTISIDNSDK